ncbi:MAG: metal-dependent hydrolase [Candidatus Acidiferrales bacterium]
MDLGTHVLASIALTRAAFPRAPRSILPIALAAGIIADVDALSSLFGPFAYLNWHRTYTHSLLAALLLAVLFAVVYRFAAPQQLQSRFSVLAILVLTLLAQCLHLLLDVCQPDGVLLFWPFSAAQIAEDWLTFVDPVILSVLVAGILLPVLFGLVSDEIGARDKKPRGKVGAIMALAVIALYIGARAIFHANAVAVLDSSAYRGELPRRVAAFPVSTSPFRWNGIVETESALHEITVSVAPGASFNTEASVTIHKPEASAALDAARNDPIALAFLRVARFPKATIEKIEAGYRVELQDLRYTSAGSSRREIVAFFELNSAGKIVNQELVWARDLRPR